jgi:hypothetical protein
VARAPLSVLLTSSLCLHPSIQHRRYDPPDAQDFKESVVAEDDAMLGDFYDIEEYNPSRCVSFTLLDRY